MALTIPKSIDPFANSLYEIQKKDSEAKAALNKATEEKRAPIEANKKKYEAEDVKTLEEQRNAQKDLVKQSEEYAKYAEEHVQKPMQFQDFKPEPIDNAKMQAFGGILAVFAAIGGRGTKTSALSAGNALAGALQGYKEGNQLKFENDYKVYKTNFDKTIKQEEENNRYIKDMLNAKNLSLTAKLNKIAIFATEHQLWEKKAAAEKGDLQEIERLNDKSEKAIDTATKTALESLKIIDTHYHQLAQEKHAANEEGIQRGKLTEEIKQHKIENEKGNYEILIGSDNKNYTYDKTHQGVVAPLATPAGVTVHSATGKNAGSNQSASQRAQLVIGAADNALRILDEIKKDYPNDNTSILMSTHPEGLVETAVSGGIKSMQSKHQQQVDTKWKGLIDEAIPVFTGGLRGSDTFRRFLIAQAPTMGAKNNKEILDMLEKNIKGMQSTFSDKAAQEFASHKEYWGVHDDGSPVTQEDVDSAMAERKNLFGSQKTIKRTGTHDGKKVIEYSDGTIDYAD